jgi:hypothetical protein
MVIMFIVKNIKYKLIAAAFILMAPCLVFTSKMAYAASASLSMSANTSNLANGGTLNLAIYENSGDESVNAVEAKITYPTQKFDFLSVNNSDAFSVVAQNTDTSGQLDIVRGALSPVKGTQLVVTLNLKAKKGMSGVAVDFSSGSLVLASATSTNILSTTSGWLNAGGRKADLNQDNHVNILDLAILLNDYKKNNQAADLNSDGQVNIFDLNQLLGQYDQ